MTSRDNPVDRPPGTADAGRAQSVQSPDEPSTDELSLGELVGRLGENLSRLLRVEIALAKTEAKEEARLAARGAGMLAGAGVAALLMLIFASLALHFGLAAWLWSGWAAAIVAVMWAVTAVALASAGRNALRRMAPPMSETTETVKEDAQWVRRPHG